jgi:uncharacterized protein (TIGR02145 family)
MIFVIGCSDNSTNNPDNTVSDTVFTDARDGKKYGLVKIGTQIWMSKNLDVSTYRNGDPIQYARTLEQWVDAARKGEGAWCYYDHDPKNGAIYGKLYNWYAVNDSRGLSPAGYHLPTDLEWSLLSENLGGEEIAGFKMKSTSGWANGGNGDNNSGFNGLPGGFCNSNGNLGNITGYGYFWSSSENSTRVNKDYYYEDQGLSVRCLRD